MDNHPYCHESYKNVIATIYKKVNNKPGQPKNFVTEEPYDFYINLKSPFLSWSPQSDEHTILLRKMCKQYNRFNFFLKVGVTEKIDGRTTVTHVFLIYVECRDNLLTKICVVDTAPFAEFNTKLLTKRISFILEIPIENDDLIEIPLNILLNDVGIEFDNPKASLQYYEKDTTEKGYCNAWILYFIDQRVKSKSFKNIYESILSSDSPTRLIIAWWKSFHK